MSIHYNDSKKILLPMIKWNDNNKNKENNNNSKEKEFSNCKDKIVDGKWCKITTVNLKVESNKIF